jgi:hypothetical protein
VFENRVLTRYYSGDQMKGEMGGACGTYGGEKRCIRVLVRRPEGKRLLL